MHKPTDLNYFYCPPGAIHGRTFRITGEEFAHLVHVMRAREGDTIRIVDGEGMAYDASISSLKHHEAHGVLLRRYRNHREPRLQLTLAVGLVKNPSKFDFLVEKTTELGVREIIPLLTERTIPSHAKVERWQKLALAAMKQSGRSFLPRILPVQRLGDLLAAAQGYDRVVIAHERTVDKAMGVQNDFPPVARVLYLVGPEGGFSDGEVEECLRIGATPRYFGARRLRTETAAIVAAASLLLPSSGEGTGFSGGADDAVDDVEDLSDR